MSQEKTGNMAAKFLLGFNSFVLLFLAVNISTIGVEINSHWPFICALGYLVFMSIFLSKWAPWKLPALIIIGIFGAIAAAVMLILGKHSPGVNPLAITHIALSAILALGGIAQLKAEMRKIEAQR